MDEIEKRDSKIINKQVSDNHIKNLIANYGIIKLITCENYYN